jgi:hypothetical protein
LRIEKAAGMLSPASEETHHEGIDGQGVDIYWSLTRSTRSGPLEEVPEFAISVTFMALLRRRTMMNVAMRRAMRINIAPPIIPPSSGVVSPPLDTEDAADLGIGEAGCVI